jgi:hypothetical protein
MKKIIYTFILSLTSVLFVNSQTINSVTPDFANQGEALTISILGVGTHFASATGTNVWLGKGSDIINPTSFSATSETVINADLSLSINEPTGLYDVNVENSLDGTVTLVQGFEVILVNGINFVSDDINLNIYPNPASDYITLNSKMKESNNIHINLVDLNGKVIRTIKKENINSFNEKIDIKNLSNGIYNVVIKIDNKIYTKKIIKN